MLAPHPSSLRRRLFDARRHPTLLVGLLLLLLPTASAKSHSADSSDSPDTPRSEWCDPGLSKKDCKDAAYCVYSKQDGCLPEGHYYYDAPPPTTASPTTTAPTTASPTKGPTGSPTPAFDCLAPGLSENDCEEAANCEWSDGEECRTTTASPTTAAPTTAPPTEGPTESPTTAEPTKSPTESPTTAEPTNSPSDRPTLGPSYSPSASPSTSVRPTAAPSSSPTETQRPSSSPTDAPSDSPSSSPSAFPTGSPSYSPSAFPSGSPSAFPTGTPSYAPSAFPSGSPTAFPSGTPSYSPSALPSGSPTEIPSGSPSYEPSAFPSASPTDSAAPSMAPIPYARAGRVDARYEPWSALPAPTRALAERLGYDRATWAAHGTNPVEQTDWDQLGGEERDAAADLGYDRSSWDCWQNHFQAYRWIDLGEPYVQAIQWWEALGWDIYSWNAYAEAPESDGLGWYDLGDGEREAAAQLCYFRRTWDGGGDEALHDGFPVERPEFRYVHWTGLDDDVRRVADEGLKYSPLSWNVLGLDAIEGRGWDGLTGYEGEAASSIGFTRLNWDCWQNHFRSYSWYDLHFYGLDFSYLALGWTELSWEGVERAPPSDGADWKDLSADERDAASELCHFRDTWDGLDATPNPTRFPLPRPRGRYVEWANQTPAVRRAAGGSLAYDAATWNGLGTADVERRRWEELTEHQKSDAVSLGFYRRTWDCFHDHYRGYGWDELGRDAGDAARGLGWSEASWEGGVEPPSYGNDWDRLSETEQTVAAVLCFFEDNWDGNNLEVVGELPITEDEAVVEGESAVSDSVDGYNSEDGSNGFDGSNGLDGSSEVDGSENIPDVRKPTPVRGSDVDDVLVVKTNSTTNSVDTTGTKRMLCILSVAFGTFIQFLL